MDHYSPPRLKVRRPRKAETTPDVMVEPLPTSEGIQEHLRVNSRVRRTYGEEPGDRWSFTRA